MKRNKAFIDAVIRNKKAFKYTYRLANNLMCEFTDWKEYDPQSFDADCLNPMIDCVKLKFNHTTIIINGLNTHKLRQ